MTGAPILTLSENQTILSQVELSPSAVVTAADTVVHDVQPYLFQLHRAEREHDFRIEIGDFLIEPVVQLASDVPTDAPEIPLIWPQRAHFDGVCGRVEAVLTSRARTPSAEWMPRAIVPLYVDSRKLSPARYQTMIVQLHALGAGLILDLVSKTLRSLGLARAETVRARSSPVELQLIEKLWWEIAGALQEISDNPVRQLRTERRVRPAWGGERLGQHTLARLASAGIDPRRPGSPRPFPAYCEQLTESERTDEHRVLRGMLLFLEQRVAGCADAMERQMAGIEAGRPLRQRADGSGLYESEDLPRLVQLRSQLERANRLQQRLHAALSTRPFVGIVPSYRLTATPVFEHVLPYRFTRQAFLRYLRASPVVLEGYEDRLKSTSQLYELWVFFQLAAAFHRSGLRCVDRAGVFRQSRRLSFALAIDRGSSLTFQGPHGRAIRLRYEPWVLLPFEARNAGESIYRGLRGPSAWSPDVLIEVLGPPEEGGAPRNVEYAIVVDAKFTARAQDHHWGQVAKYLFIRATATSRQVVKQVWLALPDDRGTISLRDSTTRWTNNGPDCSFDEIVFGELRLLPSDEERNLTEAESGLLADPEPAATAFVSGLLRYLEFLPSQPRWARVN